MSMSTSFTGDDERRNPLTVRDINVRSLGKQHRRPWHIYPMNSFQQIHGACTLHRLVRTIEERVGDYSCQYVAEVQKVRTVQQQLRSTQQIWPCFRTLETSQARGTTVNVPGK